MAKVVIATRKSPLALVQARLVAAHLQAALGLEPELLPITTTGDRQTDWSLEAKGGKGLFTSELEAAVSRGTADLAVHSTKDLPGDMAADLAIAGYLPRADPRDVLVLRVGIEAPQTLATGSARRRLQAAYIFPEVAFTEIRGNVDTRLRKIAEQHVADGTLLAAAGLQRLGIAGWPGLEFHPLSVDQMVPAVGQAAIAIQCRAADLALYTGGFDAATARSMALERALQAALGAGCHTAFAAHAAGDTLYFFHEACGLRTFPLDAADYASPAATSRRVLRSLNLGAVDSVP